jgi:LytS/YehU family sensor histidine kinase
MYSYRLSGSENTTWSIPQNKHNVSLVGLRPGKYSFEVKSLGWNGQWGQPSVLHFTIQPPLVQRCWFLITAGLILAIIITFLVRYRIKQIRHEAAMKEQLAETEMMALRAQMNPHFLFNSLNAIDNLIQTKQHDKATTYLGRFARLLRMVLDSSKNKLVPFDRDFAALQLYIDMERFRSSDKFQYEISASPELLNGGYHIPPLLAQPFIENAIHHGLLNKQSNDRMLKVKATLQDDYIMFRIEDNGIGRKKAMEINAVNRPDHVSYGWQITAQRLGMHNGGDGINDIIIHDLYQDNEATGTCVILKIKINTN